MKKEDLMTGAGKVMECGNVRPGENVLIVTDTAQPLSISQALFDAAEQYGAVPVTITMDPVPPGGDLPEPVNEALKAADYIVAATSTSIYHSAGMHAAHVAPNTARGVTLSECTEDMLAAGGIMADFKAIRPEVLRIGKIFTGGKSLRLRTPAGTDLTASIEGRSSWDNTGMADQPGMLEGLPTIEVFIAPVEDSINGVIVVDASCSGGVGIIGEPIRITVKDGKAVEISGGKEAEKLKALVEAVGDPRAYQISEIAVGLNPEARITGFINEDEGKYGTCHCAIGNNTGFGGFNEVPLHIDMVQWKPTLEIDGVCIFRDGEKII